MVTSPAVSGEESSDHGLRTTGRDLTEYESHRTLDMMFRARAGQALAYLDSLKPVSGDQPLFLLTRARVHREFLPVDDEKKDVVKQMSAPLFRDLDRTIEVCTQRIEAGDEDPKLYLYRGWAWMFKSHVHTFQRSFWSAGREAKKGKSDLERYLRNKPSDPIANSIMGAFLYFADTLPKAYKFVSKLLFLPSGDRERGLEMMELAVGWDSLIETDNRLILYSVYIGFEGRFEEGVEGFESLIERHPMHATFRRPSGVMLALKPRFSQSQRQSIDAAIEQLGTVAPGDSERSTFSLLQLMGAHSDRFYNPNRASSGFQALIDASPEHPDWVPGFSAFELGRLRAAQGEWKEAERLFLHVINDPRAEYLHDESRDMIKELESHGDATLPGAGLIQSIYENGDDALHKLEAIDDPSAAEWFYLGEARLAAGDDVGALAAYESALEIDAPRWDEAIQMIAASRAGELTGASGRYDDAGRLFKRAREYWHKEFLYDWLLEGRARYFERLGKGKEVPPVRWFAASQAAR